MVMRAPAPAYRGEGPHALWHVSEDPAITRFAPHRAKTALTDALLVWAVDTRHLPLFWYPRDCPRCTFWPGPRTTDADAERFWVADGTERSTSSRIVGSSACEPRGSTRTDCRRTPSSRVPR